VQELRKDFLPGAVALKRSAELSTYSAMSKPAVLTVAELNKIDQLSYDKANRILEEARALLLRIDYDLAVRRAQEAFELYLKCVFRFLQAEYPTNHDVKKEIYALTTAFKPASVRT
jgi:HEPN domain